jgi:hypothetical protein
MAESIGEVDHDRIQFMYQWVSNSVAMGAVFCFDDQSRVPGSIALGNEFFRWDQAFEHRFGGEFVARSPGVVEKQKIRVQLRGENVEYEFDHTRQIGRSWFGDRPIIEFECPTGEIMLFSYQPVDGTRDAWCRMIPTLWDTPLPYGFMSRHWDRLKFVIGNILRSFVAYWLVASFTAAAIHWWRQ